MVMCYNYDGEGTLCEIVEVAVLNPGLQLGEHLMVDCQAVAAPHDGLVDQLRVGESAAAHLLVLRWALAERVQDTTCCKNTC